MGELDPGWWGKITRDGFFHVLLGTCSGEGSAAGNVLPPGPPSPFSAASGQGDMAAAGVAGEVVPAASRGRRVPSSMGDTLLYRVRRLTSLSIFNKLGTNLYPSISTI